MMSPRATQIKRLCISLRECVEIETRLTNLLLIGLIVIGYFLCVSVTYKLTKASVPFAYEPLPKMDQLCRRSRSKLNHRCFLYFQCLK